MIHVVFTLANNSGAPYFNWFARRASKEKNVKFSFVCMFPERPNMIDEVGEFGCDCYHVPYNCDNRKKDLLKSAFQLYKLFKKIKPDVVHGHLFDDSLPSLLAAKLARVPMRVITKGDTGFHYYYAPKWVMMDKLNNRNSTHIIAISNQNRDLINEAESPDQSKMTVIHHGIPLDELTDQNPTIIENLRKKFKAEGKKIIGNVSRLIEWKGQELIINAAEQLYKKRQDIVFLLAGEGPDRERLEGIIKEKGLEKVVILAGWVDRSEMPSFYGLMDIYCHTATKEPFGFVIAEAMGNGKPVVSTDTGVAADVITNGGNGFLFPEGDAEKLGEALEQLLNKDLAVVAENAKKTAFDQLDFEIMFNNYHDLYKSYLTK